MYAADDHVVVETAACRVEHVTCHFASVIIFQYIVPSIMRYV